MDDRNDMDDKSKVKTAQPFSEDNADTSFSGMTGGEAKPRPDAFDDLDEKKQESNKTTQRQE